MFGRYHFFIIPTSNLKMLIFCQFCSYFRCYICDDDVQYSRTGHLAQLVTNIKKQSGADPVKRPEKSKNQTTVSFYFEILFFLSMSISIYLEVKDEASVLEAKENSETANTENKSENKENSSNKNKNIMKERAEKTQNCITTEGNVVIPVKGLSNLGNTCFFNAVIQVKLILNLSNLKTNTFY